MSVGAVPDSLDKTIKELGANGEYFSGLISWFDQQIAQHPRNTPLGQTNNEEHWPLLAATIVRTRESIVHAFLTLLVACVFVVSQDLSS